MANWKNNKKLGFGLMRLPKVEDKIDISAVCKLADAFMERGFTYFDTAYAYAGSEVAFREAVVKRHPREQFTVASKLAGWMLNDTLTPEAMFQEQLERCGIEYFDYYMLHSLQESRMPAYDNIDCWGFCSRKKQEGKIKNIGFSFHGDPVLLEKLLIAHPEIDFVQLQINYVDWEDNVIYAKENYALCEKYGKDVIVMEPVKGGFLAQLPQDLQAKLAVLDNTASAASYALRFAGSLPQVKMVLSGMNTMEQLQENMDIFADFKPVDEAEKAALAEVTAGLRAKPTVPCTDCKYCCKDCPESIKIPDIFKAYNTLLTFGEHARPHLYYDNLLATGSGKANACIQCGQCEAACPQHIEIIEKLQQASALLDK